MDTFHARSVELSGGFTLDRTSGEVFDLFSPQGEAFWAPGWSPEFLYPLGGSWERGLIFRTRTEGRDVVWVVTDLDRSARHVEYYRLAPDRHVARVAVRCAALGASSTHVHVSYAYVGLSEHGNAELAGMTPASYDETMQQWKRWIDTYFSRGDGST